MRQSKLREMLEKKKRLPRTHNNITFSEMNYCLNVSTFLFNSVCDCYKYRRLCKSVKFRDTDEGNTSSFPLFLIFFFLREAHLIEHYMRGIQSFSHCFFLQTFIISFILLVLFIKLVLHITIDYVFIIKGYLL